MYGNKKHLTGVWKAGVMAGVPSVYNLAPPSPAGLGVVCRKPGLPAQTALIGSQVCYHHGNNADPEERDCPAAFSDIQDVHILSGFVRDHLPDLQPEPAVMEHCMYTVSVWAAGPGPPAALGAGRWGRPALRSLGQTRPDP